MYLDDYIRELDHITAEAEWKEKIKQTLQNTVTQPSAAKPSKKVWLLPAAAAACCLVFSLILLPQLFSSTDPGIGSGQPCPALPMLTVEFESSGMGYEGLMAHSVDELIGGNPWSENANLSTLPVFQNTAKIHPAGFLEDSAKFPVSRLEERIQQIADAFGEPITSMEKNMGKSGVKEGIVEYISSIDADCPSYKITAYAYGDIRIELKQPVTLPDNLGKITSRGNAEKLADYFAKEYKSLTGFKKPAIDVWGDYDIYNQQSWSSNIYDSSGDLTQQIVNYNLGSAHFALNDQRQLFIIWLSEPDLSQKIGDYPILSADEAKKQLLNGNYYTTVPAEIPGEEAVEHVELVYRAEATLDCFMPFYKFYVNIPELSKNMDFPIHTYGIFYVPAVSPEYLNDLPEPEIHFNEK